MFRSPFKLILQLSTSSLLMLFYSLTCLADVSTLQNGLQLTNTFQQPGNYYTDPSMPTPNPALYPPPPPKSSALPLQPFMPTLTGQLNITKDEASKLLNGYTNPSLPTPNPAFNPPPPVVKPIVVASTQPAASTESKNSSTQSNTSGADTTAGAAAGGAQTAASTTSTNGNGSNATQQQQVSNNLSDLQNCVPGNYAFPSATKPITTNTYYGGSTVAPPLTTYTVAGMQNGKCVVSITQSAVVPPTVQNGTVVPAAASASPAANVSRCNLSPNDLSSLVSQTQKNQMGGYYGTTTVGANYYNKQSIQNSCQSSLVVNGAAIPYQSFP